MAEVVQRRCNPPDVRASLPPYSDHQHAVSIFEDFRALKSSYVPFVGWGRLPYKGATTTIGSDGHRRHGLQDGAVDLPVARLFGGSTMWGTGADDKGTIAAQFQRLAGRFRVINHGETGYNTRQNLADLVNTLNTKQRTKLVVFYIGANDVVTLCRKDTRLNGHGQEALMRSRLEGSPAEQRGQHAALKQILYDLFLKHTARITERLVRKSVEIGETKIYDCDTQQEKALKVVDVAIETLKLAREIAAAANAEFIAILQPVAYLGQAKVDYLKLDQHTGDQYRMIYQHLQKQIEEIDRPWLLDWTDAFDGDHPLYIDLFHVTDAGNRIVAERLVRHLQKIRSGRASPERAQ